jgi:DNA-binding response OmpR family regulator
MRVLVVEWDGSTVPGPSIAATLESAGREAYPAADPVEARAALAAWQPDCLVLDAAGLLQWGFAAVRDTLAAAAGAGVPVVLVSGVAPAHMRALAARTGAARVVRRPFAPADLLRAVDTAHQS